ncbi:MAG: M13 family metallopeptidase, partial [Bacteroidota bacterium]
MLKAAAVAETTPGTVDHVIGTFYASAMDTAKCEAQGYTTIQPLLDKAKSVTDAQSLMQTLGHLHRHGVGGGFGIWVDQDAKNSTETILNFFQGGMGLPDKDFYLSKAPARAEMRDKYVAYLKSLLALIGNDEGTAGQMAARVLEIETELAKSSLSLLERRNPELTYHKMGFDGLKALAPALPWEVYFGEIGMETGIEFNVGMPDFFKRLNGLFGELSMQDWQTYLQTVVVRSMAPYLSSDFVNADFEFSGKVMNGAEALRPRWQRVAESANWSFGMAIGEKYVQSHFSPRAKEIALEMVHNILDEMKTRLANLDWMSAETKEQAVHKVSTITPKIGYPDKWRDYSKMDMTDESFVRNILVSRAFNFDYRLAKVGKPLDKTEWRLPPQIVNAFYNPSRNEIVFPAGILQAPFFDEHVAPELNYGGFGAVIGHELIHAFDDQGSKFDADGNLIRRRTDDGVPQVEV